MLKHLIYVLLMVAGFVQAMELRTDPKTGGRLFINEEVLARICRDAQVVNYAADYYSLLPGQKDSLKGIFADFTATYAQLLWSPDAAIRELSYDHVVYFDQGYKILKENLMLAMIDFD